MREFCYNRVNFDKKRFVANEIPSKVDVSFVKMIVITWDNCIIEFRMRDQVCYECACLHPVAVKGKCHIFCSRKAAQSRVCICQSLHLAESHDGNRQNTSHFVMKLQNILSYAKSILLKWIYASWKCAVDK